ncbi:MAG: AzlC family ABC transporter permease [Clostridia bacterium]|nr:AzlC family ABC transporter permease [Clostridia bacterium]
MNSFLFGLKSGVPIGLGYLSVSFTFGIMAVSYGFEWWQAVLISMTTVTSAGQLAGIGVMVNPGQYIQMLISQLTINVRYSFMSISLSQKVSSSFNGIKRWFAAFLMTDEIFAVASSQKEVTEKFFFGLMVMPYLGWTFGTLAGSILGNILPDIVLNSLCLAIYGMFLAIISPEARKSKAVISVVAVAAILHCIFYYVPVLNKISSGLTVSICAILAAVFGALLFPVNDEEGEGNV